MSGRTPPGTNFAVAGTGALGSMGSFETVVLEML
jgi:hypothetical protein